MKQIIPTMKTFTNLCCLLTLLCSISYVTAQTTQVKITVDWEDVSYLNKVEVYNPANYKILDICNTNVTTDAVNQCYNASGTDLIFTGTYNLGCIANATGYYVKLFNINGSAWSNGTISINVDGVEVVNNNGSLADTSGYTIAFDVEDKDATDQCTPLPDSDNDGVIDLIDLDDDNDGILDIDEGLGIDSFNCTIPALNFYDGAYDSLASTGDEGEEGAVYRFPNAVFGENYDVLVEIVEMHDATLTSSGIDIDTVDNPNYLQTRIEFTGNDNPVTGTDYPGDPNPTTGLDYPGIIFKFTIVDNTIPNNTTPTTNLIRIGGTTWDVDGTTERRESVRYYNPSAYGVDNPTTLQVTDINGDASEIEMTAGGILEGPGFSTLTQLRSYFQFISSEFTLRMQNVRTDYTGSNVREYSMSFTQCDVLDFKSSSIIITQGEDTDGDGISNDKDIDSDNDGIPDNVEAQSTTGYSIPDGSVNPVTGIDTAYGDGLILEDTDGDEIFDFLDTDSDNDGTLDVDENGDPDPLSGIDTPDADGLDNSFDDVPTLSDVNDEITTGTLAELTTSFLDSDGDIPLGGDLDYRDAIDVYYDSATIDFDGENDYVDSEQILGGLPNASIMAWILLKDNTFTSESFIIGQDNFNLRVQRSDNVLVAQVNTNTFTLPISTAFDLNKWAHVAAVYQGGIFKVYINGEEQLNETLTGALNASLDNFTIELM